LHSYVDWDHPTAADQPSAADHPTADDIAAADHPTSQIPGRWLHSAEEPPGTTSQPPTRDLDGVRAREAQPSGGDSLGVPSQASLPQPHRSKLANLL